MEWVHCHIARRPAPPAERVPGIPAPISAIVMKLLAKTAEERYQTAAGVEARPPALPSGMGGATAVSTRSRWASTTRRTGF